MRERERAVVVVGGVNAEAEPEVEAFFSFFLCWRVVIDNHPAEADGFSELLWSKDLTQ